MTDPYASHHAQVEDPGPTSLGLHRLFDGSATAPAAAWHGDWNRYAAWLYSVCLRRGVQGGDARDVVQEVFSRSRASADSGTTIPERRYARGWSAS